MTRYLSTPITIVWLVLAALMVLSWLIGNRYESADASGIGTITVALMVIAFLKVRVVMFHFMEAKVAPLALRLLADAWVVGVCLIVLLMYFAPPTAG